MRMHKDHSIELFIFFLIFFITPTQIETSTSDYAPALFTFVFNVLFEQDFSTRVLRPLMLSVPITLISLKIYLLLKKRFF